MSKFQIGDKVEVIDDGKIYDSYPSWLDKYMPSYSSKYVGYMGYSNGFTGKIIALGVHHTIPMDGMLYLIENEDEVCLIGEKGIELIKGGCEMRKSDLKNGHVVVTREGKNYIVSKDGTYVDGILARIGNFMDICGYQDDLTYDGLEEFDIMEVYSGKMWQILEHISKTGQIPLKECNLVWKREESSPIKTKLQKILVDISAVLESLEK